MLDAGQKKIITFKYPVSPPASPEGEVDGGQAETGNQHLLLKGITMCYQCFLPQNSKKISIKGLKNLLTGRRPRLQHPP
jgi:hypothetical protein